MGIYVFNIYLFTFVYISKINKGKCTKNVWHETVLYKESIALSNVGVVINQKGPRIHNLIHNNKIASSYMTIKSTS